MSLNESINKYDKLKNLLESKRLEEFCYKEKVQIYKIRLMTSLMKQVSHETISSYIADIILQHEIQVKLSAQINQKLTIGEAVVVVPVYAKEANIDKLIEAILKQSGDFSVVLYVNGYEPAVTQKELVQTISSIDKLIGQHKNMHIISHLYAQKATMGAIRDHLLSTLYLATKKGNNPVVIGLDADTYQLGNGYIKAAIANTNQPGTAFVKGQLRWMNHHYGQEHPYAYLEDIIEMIFSTYFTNSTSIVSSGGGTSFLLDIAYDSGGYNISTNMGEDIELGMTIKYRYGKRKGKKIPNKVYTSPRRALDAINQGGGILDQWNMESNEFSPIAEFDSQSKSNEIQHLDTILHTIFKGDNISIDDLKLINDRISIIIKKLKNIYRKYENLEETEYKKIKKVYEKLLRWINFVLKKTDYYAVPLNNIRGKTRGIYITHPILEEQELLQTQSKKKIS